MSAKVSDFLGVNYGWTYGEDNWNVGMDANLLQSSYLLSATIKGVVSNLPAMVSGDAYFNTSDSRVYYCVNSVIYSTEIPINKVLFDTVAQVQYVFNGAALQVANYITQGSGDVRYILQSSAGSTGSQVLAASTPAAGRTALGLGSASTQPSSAFEPAITSGTTAQYIRGDKSLSTFNTDVIAAPLTGLSVGSSTVITATDTVLTASGKLQAQVTLKAPLASPALTGTPTAPTAAAGTNTTQLATTAFVTSAVSSGGSVTSVAGKTGAVTLVKGDVGLGNVDNTSDVNKPVSTAQQSALDLKAPLASPAFTGTPTAPTATTGTNTTQIATTAFVLANSATASQNFLFVQDQKSGGTNGGSSQASVYTQRDLNTVVVNQISGASLATGVGEITLPAGTYYLEAKAPVRGGTNGRARIYNKTDSTALVLGAGTYLNSNVFQTEQTVNGYFTITASKVIFLQSLVTTAQATNGLGTAVSAFSEIEIYSEVRIWKLS